MKKIFTCSREISATAQEVFAAISHPARLARWWGPAGFTNSFRTCEFKNGGAWSFIMHGPDGNNYPNENTFIEIVPHKKVILDHISEPKFRLTIGLEVTPHGTTVTWAQEFESAEVANSIEHIVVPANNQNLERLAAEIKRN